MQCSAWPRAGNDRAGRGIGEGVWTDRDGAFELPAVPAGDIAIACRGEAHLYTHGLRRITVTPSQHLEIEVPVVKIGEDVGMDLADIGAAFDFYALVARLDRVRHEGPAAEAGFRDGDVVIAVGGEPVTELSRLSIWFLVARHPPGTRVEMTVRRGAETVTGTMVLAPNGGL